MTPNALHPAWLIGLAAALALVPVLMGLFTAYLKISVVLGMLKSGLGTQHAPSGLVVMALSLSLTGYTMSPVFEECALRLARIDLAHVANNPSISSLQVLGPAFEPLRDFVARHAGPRELAALESLSRKDSAAPDSGVNEPGATESASAGSVTAPLRVLLPAFVLTELKEAFAMAFVLLLPFLIIDLIVANLLVGMGMMMVSPTLVSLPLKIILLVLSDGWLLIAQGLLQSYQ